MDCKIPLGSAVVLPNSRRVLRGHDAHTSWLPQTFGKHESFGL
jgi:hypothetical protein